MEFCTQSPTRAKLNCRTASFLPVDSAHRLIGFLVEFNSLKCGTVSWLLACCQPGTSDSRENFIALKGLLPSLNQCGYDEY